jgi:hypothetical protein
MGYKNLCHRVAVSDDFRGRPYIHDIGVLKTLNLVHVKILKMHDTMTQ